MNGGSTRSKKARKLIIVMPRGIGRTLLGTPAGPAQP
jgi:hypothetical protein